MSTEFGRRPPPGRLRRARGRSQSCIARTWNRKFSASAVCATRRPRVPSSKSSTLHVIEPRLEPPPALAGVAGELGRGLDQVLPVQHLEVVADRADRQPRARGELPDVRRPLDAEQLGEPAADRVVEGHQQRRPARRSGSRSGARLRGRGEVPLGGGTTGHPVSLVPSRHVVQDLLYNSEPARAGPSELASRCSATCSALARVNLERDRREVLLPVEKGRAAELEHPGRVGRRRTGGGARRRRRTWRSGRGRRWAGTRPRRRPRRCSLPISPARWSGTVGRSQCSRGPRLRPIGSFIADVEVELPALVAPHQPLLRGRVGRPGAPALGGVLPAARRLLVGQRLERLHPQRVDLERVDVPPGHLLDGDRRAGRRVRWRPGRGRRSPRLTRAPCRPSNQPSLRRLVPNRNFSSPKPAVWDQTARCSHPTRPDRTRAARGRPGSGHGYAVHDRRTGGRVELGGLRHPVRV